jgi:outer membrane biosynthesis protein TonB
MTNRKCMLLSLFSVCVCDGFLCVCGFPSANLTRRMCLFVVACCLFVFIHRSVSDVDEATWLIEHDGKIDTSTEGRKNSKKRTQELKKKAAAVKEQKKEAIEKKEKKDKKEKKSKKESKKEKKKKVESTSKTSSGRSIEELKEQKKEQRELDKRRKKRSREREKALARVAKKQKLGRSPSLPTDPENEDNSLLDSDKRTRATAIVNAYVTRMANAEDYKSLALGGVLAIPAAMVDSTGLLGLTLAFRAAAGELDMPGDGGAGGADTNYNASNKLKPWESIDCDRPRTHQERTERLEKKMRLLEKEVERVRANAARRRALAAQALEQRASIESKIVENDLLARVNHFKKKKKVVPLTATKAAAAALEESPPPVQQPVEDEASAAANEDGGDEEEEEEEDSMEIDNGNALETHGHDGGADGQAVDAAKE